MGHIIVFFAIFFYAGCSWCSVIFGDKYLEDLQSVIVLFRHGDRAPSDSFPNDPYFDESYWPMGHGQLTNLRGNFLITLMKPSVHIFSDEKGIVNLTAVMWDTKGKERLYHLGRWLRNRYSFFLPDKYSSKDIYVRSTNSDRTLMSAAAVLAGLYPPRSFQMWNPGLPWQPIPIHTKAQKEDEVLAMRKICNKYREELQEVTETEYFKNIRELYADFLTDISNYTGWKSPGVVEMRILQTVLDIYNNYNKSFLPCWEKYLHKETLMKLAGVAHERYTFSTEMKRLLTGPFWDNLFRHFDNVINNVTGTPKFIMLSAHDTTIVSLLNSMGVYDGRPPVFAATLIWELKKTSRGKHYVNLFYKKIAPKPHRLATRGCEIDCIYERFKRDLESVTLDSDVWEEQCKNTDNFGRIPKKWPDESVKNSEKPFFVE